MGHGGIVETSSLVGIAGTIVDNLYGWKVCVRGSLEILLGFVVRSFYFAIASTYLRSLSPVWHASEPGIWSMPD